MTTRSRLSLLHCFLCLYVIFAAGCENTVDTVTAGSAAHGHHGGHTFRMPDGSSLELEMTLDEEGRRMIIYAQDSISHKPVSLPADSLKGAFESEGSNFETKFSSDTRPSDPDGHSSRFAIDLDELPQQLLTADRFTVTVWYPSQGRTLSVSMTHSNDHAHTYHHD